MEKYILRINNEIDITDFITQNLSIDYSLKDIKNLSKRKSSFTKPFTIPITKQTEEIFKGVFNINNKTFDTNSTLNAELIENGNLILKGSLYLEDIHPNYYEVTLANNNLIIYQDIADKNLDDLVFSDLYSHTITKQHILDQWNNPNEHNGSGLTYTYIDYNNIVQTVFDLEQDYAIMPSVHVYELFSKIFSDNGYSFTMSSEMESIIKRLVIPYNGSLDDFTDTYLYHKSHFNSEAGQVKLAGGLFDNQASLKFNAGDYEYIHNNLTASILETPVNGMYRLKFILSAKDTSGSGSVSIKIHDYTDYPKQIIDIGEVDLTGSQQTFEVSKDVYFAKGSSKYVQFIYDNPETTIVYDTSTFEVSALNYLYHGTKTININDVLPVDYKQKDFLNDVLKMFNLYIYADDIDVKKLHIETYDEFYESNIIDWSNKLDSDDLKFKILNSQLSKTYNFSFTDESDIYNNDYKTQKNKTIYSNSLTNPSTLAANSIEEIKLNCTPLVDVHVNDYFRIGKSISENGKREYKPKILFAVVSDISDGDWKLFDDNYSNPTYNIIDNVVYASHYMNSDITSEDNLHLSFNSTDTYIDLYGTPQYNNKNLFNQYYQKDIESNLNGDYKLLTAKFKLNSLDVKQSTFKKLIYINDDRIGEAYYRLNRIKNYRSSEELVECELIKVNPYTIDYDNLITPNILTLLPISSIAKDNVVGSSSSSSSSSGSIDLSDYYSKSQTNTLLNEKANVDDIANKVDKNSGNTITAIHDFTSGLKIDDKLINFDAGNNQIVINGNIRVEGGISATSDVMAFGSGNTNASVFDQLGSYVDNSTIKFIGGVLSGNTGGVGGGVSFGVLPTISGGTNQTAWTANRLVYNNSTTQLSSLAAITANRVLISDTSGLPIAATTTATEIGYINGVTSAIQTQLNSKAASSDYLPLTGGTVTGAISLNSTSTANLIDFNGNSTSDARGIHFNGRAALTADATDGFLRINDSGAFPKGTYTYGNFYVNSIGRVGLGIDPNTTTAPLHIKSGVNGEKLILEGGNEASFISLYNGSTGIGAIGKGESGSNAMWVGTATAEPLKLYTNNIVRVTIDTAGNLVASGEVTAYSDERLKSNIKRLDKRNSLAKIMALEPVSYEKDDKQSIGLVAQKVKKIIPELVMGEETESSYLSMNYAQLTAVLVAGMQMQQEQINNLEKRIKELE